MQLGESTIMAWVSFPDLTSMEMKPALARLSRTCPTRPFTGKLQYDLSGSPTTGSGVDVFAPGACYSLDLVLHSNGKLYPTVNESPLLLPSSTNGIIEFDSAHFRGQLRGNLVAGLRNGRLYLFVLDESGGKVIFGPSSILDASGLDLTQGPDGALLVTEVNSNAIVFHKPVEPPYGSLVVKSVFPRRGGAGGCTLLQVFGEKLVDAASPTTTVTVGGNLCSLVTFSADKLECRLPTGAGLVDVVVSNGSSTSTFLKVYRYVGGHPS
jgi:hypothetical protein